MLVPTFPWRSTYSHAFRLRLCLCVCTSVSRTQPGVLIPGPNPVILRLSHFVKCSSHSLNSSLSLVASNVNPNAHKQHLSKWHLIHYTPPHTHTQKKGNAPMYTLTFLVLSQSCGFIPLTTDLSAAVCTTKSNISFNAVWWTLTKSHLLALQFADVYH